MTAVPPVPPVTPVTVRAEATPAPAVPAYEVEAHVPLEQVRATLGAGERVVVALDGRSAAGKSTLAARLADGQDDWCVVHTDDVAWYESFFDWTPLLVDGVLKPFAAGEAVSYRPASWQERGRSGAIDVPANTRVLVVEGVGSAQAALTAWLDHVVWVHTPHEAVCEREAQRIAEGHTSAELSREWLAGEAGFLDADRPWDRADLVIAGTPIEQSRTVGAGDSMDVIGGSDAVDTLGGAGVVTLRRAS